MGGKWGQAPAAAWVGGHAGGLLVIGKCASGVEGDGGWDVEASRGGEGGAATQNP